MMGKATFSDVAAIIGSALVGRDRPVSAFEPFPPQQDGAVAFFSGELAPHETIAINARCLIICRPEVAGAISKRGASVVSSDYPKFDFARVHREFFPPPPTKGIHPSVEMDGDLIFGDGIEIGPGSLLSGRIKLGDGCRIGANTCLLNDVTLGVGVVVRNGTVIGDNAFSFGFGPGGKAVHFPSVGSVAIGDDVHVGSNALIARGINEATAISDGCKINDFAHIGNSVTVGLNSMIMAHTDISARVSIGERCWIGQSSAIIQAVQLGDNVQVAAGSVVVKDVPAGYVVRGVPAELWRLRPE